MNRSRLFAAAMTAAVLLVAAGCKDAVSPPSVPNAGKVAPDFSVRDVNPTSPRYDELVSPRDYTGMVSAWYFGHAT